MKKLFFLILASYVTVSVSAANYFVQSGTTGAATWDATVIAANSGTLVDLTTEAKSFNAWYNATFTAAASELTKIYIARGTYVFTDRFNYQDKIHLLGGYDGSSLNRTTGADFWDFQDETVFDGNNNNSRFFYPSSATRTNVIFDGLTFANGGGSAGAAITLRGNTIIRNCKLIDNVNNSTSVNGGAIYLYGGGSVYNSYFEGNSNNVSNGLGGDIGSSNSGVACVIDGNKFVNSYASYRGAVLAAAGATTVTFSNNLIINPTGSAAVVVVGTTTSKPNVSIINNTFAKNTVSSIHVFGQVNGYPNLKIYNCVFWSPSTLVGGLGKVSGDGDATIVIKNCALMEAFPAAWTSADNFMIEGDNTGDLPEAKYPAFMDPANGDFRIAATSALHNTGAVFADVPNVTDFFGSTRPLGSSPEIGYYEFDETHTDNKSIKTSATRAILRDGMLAIENNEEIPALAHVFNISGKVIHVKHLNAGEEADFVLQKGSYLIRISTVRGTVNSKIIVP